MVIITVVMTNLMVIFIIEVFVVIIPFIVLKLLGALIFNGFSKS